MKAISLNVPSSVRSIFLVLAAFLLFADTMFAQNEAGAAIMAIEEKPAAAAGKASAASGQGGGRTTNSPTFSRPKTSTAGTTKPRTAPRRSTTANSSARWDGFVVGDKYTFLNFEIAQTVQPIWTIAAKNAGASGLVQVEVTIDQHGNVISARGRTGHALLRPEAEKAALATKFNRPTFGGRPARAVGFVVYRFGPAED